MNTYRWFFLSVRYLKLHARTNCATGSTLPLAMCTQSVDRSADVTDVFRSVIYDIYEWIDWFDNNSDMWAV